MDLTAVPGLEPDHRRRLQEAGVPDAAALAHAPDLPALAERTGIPLDRLRALQADALDLEDDAGIAIQAPAPFQEAAQALWRSAEDAREAALARARDAEEKLRAVAVDAVAALERRLATLRAALAPRRS